MLVTMQVALLNEVPAGGLVREIIPGSSADLAGIKVGDIIVVFDGQKVADLEGGLAQLMLPYKIGDKVLVEIYRDNKSQTLTVELRGES